MFAMYYPGCLRTHPHTMTVLHDTMLTLKNDHCCIVMTGDHSTSNQGLERGDSIDVSFQTQEQCVPPITHCHLTTSQRGNLYLCEQTNGVWECI